MKITKIAAIGTTGALIAALASPVLADDITPAATQNGGSVNATNSAVNTSTVNGSAASNVTGNAGLNSVAGTANQQVNVLVIDAASGKTNIKGSLKQTGAKGTITENLSAGGVSTIGGSSASNVTGNAGVNSAAGTANQQINALVTTAKAADAISNGTGSTQTGGGGTITLNGRAAPNAGCGVPVSDPCGYNSSVQDSAGSNVSGNLGLNSSAGVVNAQMNAMYLTNGAGAKPSTVDQTHTQTSNVGGSATDAALYSNTNAQITGSAGNATKGNVGINSAGGAGNLQANLTSVVNGVTGGGAGGSLPVNQKLTQTTGPSTTMVTTPNGPNFSSSITSGQSTTGVAGLNSGAGIQNAQINAVNLINGTSSGTPKVTQSVTQTTQNVNSTETALFDTSIVGPNVGNNAQGIVGANSAAGVQNAQSNAVTLLNGTGSGNSSYAQSALQTINNATVNQTVDVLNNSSVAGGANASGIAAFNSAAGTANQQSNAAILVNGAGGNATIAQGSIAPAQSISGLSASQVGPNNYSPFVNQSTIGDSTGSGASGLVQISSAAGVGNQQANNTAFFSAGANPVSNNTSPAQNLTQNANGSATLTTAASTSDINANAGANVSGIAAFNSASGIGNQQSNNTLVFNKQSGDFTPIANPTQTQGAIAVTQSGGSNAANINGNAFQNAKGAVSANSSTGAFNQQGNLLLVTSSNLASTAPTLTQNAGPLTVVSSAVNTATIGGNAFAGVTGTASANVSAGTGNQQLNVVQVGNK